MARFETAYLIYNPTAGKIVRHPDILEQTKREIGKQVGQLHLAPTTGPEMAGALAASCVEKGADLLLVAGGDGTLNEVLNGVVGSRVPVATLPGGTANVFAMETRLGRNMTRVAHKLGDLVPTEIPLGVARRDGKPPRYFLLMAGAGVDAQIVERVSAPLKRRLGKAAYWLGGFSLVGQTLPEFRVHVDGREFRSSFLLASRVKNYGGDLEIARHADLLRPELAVVSFAGHSSFRYLKYFSGVLMDRLDGMSGVEVFSCRQLTIEPDQDRIAVQVDGEALGALPIDLSIAAERVTMLLPPTYLTRYSPASR